MSTDHDDRNQIIGDLLSWVRQNEAAGMEWFLAVPGAHEAEATVVEATAAPPPPANADVVEDDPFLVVCREFVDGALALIQGQPARSSAPVPAAEKEKALAALRAEVMPCTACSLHETRHSVVFGSGNPAADVVFVGEAPGRDEDLQGEPFVGASGQLLTKILGAIGYRRDDVFICNILKCRPPNNRDPQAGEVATCEPHLKRQLAILDPKVICCLGRVAAQTLLGTDASLKRLRESVHFYEGIPVMATYHPAALLRNPAWKRDTWNDVRRLAALVEALAVEGR